MRDLNHSPKIAKLRLGLVLRLELSSVGLALRLYRVAKNSDDLGGCRCVLKG